MKHILWISASEAPTIIIKSIVSESLIGRLGLLLLFAEDHVISEDGNEKAMSTGMIKMERRN